MSGTVDIQQIYSLTPMQEGMLFHRLHDEDQAYFLQMHLKLRGELDLHLFRQSVNNLIERHDILRTVFLYEETKKTLQVVLSERQAEVTSECLADWTPERINARIEEFKAEDRIRGFDLSEDVPMRTSIFQTGRDTFEVIWSFHHIVVDGWSMGILMKDFFEMYGALYTGTAPILNSVRPYSDFIRWYEQQDKQEAAEYWRHYLAGYEEQATLPKLPMSAERNNEYLQREEIRKLDAETVRRLVQIGNGCGATVNTVIQVAWGVLLGKYNHTRDVVFGSVISGREAQVTGIESMVGLFINTIPVRIRLEGEVSFAETVQRAQEEALESTQFGYFPLVDIQSFSSLRQGLVDQIMAFENFVQTPSLDDRNVGFQIEGVSGFEQTHYDFNIIVLPEDDGMSVKFTYNAAVYDEELIRRAMGHYCRILETVSMHPDILNEEIVMVSEEEKWQLTIENNLTEQEYARDKTLHGLFEEQVRQTPNAVALLFEDRQWTYRELDEKANRLAMQLRTLGMGAGKPVGILAERGPDMVAGVLGVLKAGGAYVPFEPGWPQSRIAGIMESLSMEHMLTTHRQLPVVRGLLREVPSLMHAVCMEETVVESHGEKQIYGLQKAGAESLEYEAVAVDAEQLAYIIFTSGSTGTPKGVAVCHRPVINLIEWVNRTFEIGAEDRILFVTSMCFDLSVYDVFGLLAAGGSVHIAGEEEIREPEKLAERLWKEPITFWDSAPAAMQQVAAYFPYMQEELRESRLRTVFLSGDWIPLKLSGTLKRYFEKVETVALGGATEATVWSNYYRIEEVKAEWASIPYGKPIQNARYYILDERLNPCPEGVGGEIYIGGECLASGYVGDPEMTERKFVADPYSSLHGGRMYRTGDRARWMADGNIEFLGRLDYQVKIRGYRIEPGEIQSALMKHPAVREAMVLDHEDGTGQKYLCAYTVLENGEETPGLEEYLAQRLPSYMIPAHFMVLESMPVTVNGKLDRKALPKPQWGRGQEYVAPRNELERQLVEIWQEVLEVERVGVTDNFFNLGGHSIKATKMNLSISRELEIKVALREIMENPTIERLARKLSVADKEGPFSIQTVAAQEYYQVSPTQKRMYLIQQFDKKGIGYNIPAAFLISGAMDKNRLKQSLSELAKRHESLRTFFFIQDGEPVQKVQPSIDIPLEFITAEQLELEYIVRRFIQPFDLEQAPLFRAALVEYEEQKYALLFDMHHIISDGVSVNVLMREFSELYQGNTLPAPVLQYKDYAFWQNQLKIEGHFEVQEAYWSNMFSDEIPSLHLPLDYPRPVMKGTEGGQIGFVVDRITRNKLEELAAESGATLFNVLLALYTVFLSKLTSQEDIVVGTPVAGRSHEDLQNLVGAFINTLPLRNQPSSEKTFLQFLSEVKVNTWRAMENQDIPFEDIVEKLNVQQDLSRTPLFDTMLVFQNMDSSGFSFGDLSVVPYVWEAEISKFDLTFTFMENGEELNGFVQYNCKLFDRETINKWCAYFEHLLRSIGELKNAKLAQIELITEDEKSLLDRYNDTAFQVSAEGTLQECFEVQAARTPNRVAVTMDGVSLTYHELNEKSNRLARTLRSDGIKPNDIVGILADRSIHMIVAIIAVLKSGGAYLPLDPELPEDRIRFILSDSESKHCLVQQHRMDVIDGFGVNVYILEDETNYDPNAENLTAIATADDAAYIIYTSGTTGTPKGVILEHRSVVNFVFTFFHCIHGLSGNPLNFSQIAPFYFDSSIKPLYGSLLLGHSLHIVPEAVRRDGTQLIRFFNENQIHITDITPTLVQLIVSVSDMKIRTLNYMLIGGEALPVKLANDIFKMFDHQPSLFNVYGPTESCVNSTWYRIPEDRTVIHSNYVPIGRPLPNQRVYVLGPSKELLPTGVVGELYIAGAGVARGYLNRPKLTEEKFVPNVFRPGEKMYRTGDLVKWMPNGDLEYLGRIDHQIKIRGNRVELREIEFHMLQHDKINKVVVTLKNRSWGESYLCAYLESSADLTIRDIRLFLHNRLPDYMIPGQFVRLQQIPVMRNGKVNRSALPDPEHQMDSGVEYVPPTNNEESEMVRLWEEVLYANSIGIDDNFFDLGGHSLNAAVLSAGIKKQFSVDLSIRDIFTHATVRRLCVYMNAFQHTDYLPIEKAAELPHYPLSSAQQRMLILHQLQEDKTSYNMPGVFRVSGPLESERLDSAIRTLIERHDSLRTSFDWIDGKPVQIIHPSVEFRMEFRRATGKVTEVDILGFVQQFHLEQAPLVRALLIQTGEQEFILSFDMHHIISDGVSMNILMDELTQLYAGNKLLPVTRQYKDFVLWQRKREENGDFERQKEYWLDRMKDDVPVIQLPLDYPRPAVYSYEGDSYSFLLDKSLTERIKSLTARTESTIFMFLMAVYQILLAKYSGNNDIVVGTPIAGRTHHDLQSVVGVFINTLCMRNRPESNKSFVEFLAEVKQNALDAYENQEYPFEELIEALGVHRDLSRNPLFDTLFVMQNFARVSDYTIKLDGVTVTPLTNTNENAKFDLTLEAFEGIGEIELRFNYSTNLFKRETIQMISGHYVQLIREIVEYPNISLSKVSLLSSEEKARILQKIHQDKHMEQSKLPSATLHECFEEQASLTPNAIAVVSGDHNLTYEDLNRRANQVARSLREIGVNPQDVVAVYLDRSIEMVVAIMGILKAGAAYLPLDIEAPEKRIRSILDQTEVAVLLTRSELTDQAPVCSHVIAINGPLLCSGDTENLTSVNKTEDLCYLIFTSGTTGLPKGVLLEHRNVLNFLETFFVMVWGRNPDPLRFSLVAPYHFDASVQTIFGSLLMGHTLYIVPESVRKDGELLACYYEDNGINISDITPTLTRLLDSACWEGRLTLSHLIIGGEQLQRDFAEAFMKKFHSSPTVLNVYGPTETCISSTAFILDHHESNNWGSSKLVPIGRPLQNQYAYVVDSNMELMPPGITGELFIGGDGVARGYFGRPDLNEERFVSNPFRFGEKMYRTGDIVRWLPNGLLEYIGRNDHQVKIRGNRVELKEIEWQLARLEGISEVIVMSIQDDKDQPVLCAYLLMECEYSVQELRQFLQKSLPDYMIPQLYAQLDKFPMLRNGKVDLHSLRERAKSLKLGVDFVEASTPIEKRLAAIWKAVLNVDRVGVHDNFFDLGGHSLRAAALKYQIHDELSVKFTLREIFLNPTISEQARLCEDKERFEDLPIVKAEEKPYYPVSSAQRRLMILSQLTGETTNYNITQLFQLKGTINQEALESAMNQLVHRHESLRTSFHWIDGEPVQQIHPPVSFTIHRVELGTETIEECAELLIKPFDLWSAPLIRIHLISRDGIFPYLLMDIHHIITDGISTEVLMKELLEMCVGGTLPPNEIQYKDYAVWQKRYLDSDWWYEHEQFWLQTLSGEIPILDLPADYPRPPVQSFEGDRHSFTLGEELITPLRELAARTKTTPHSILLGVYYVLLSKYSGQEDIIIGIPVSGRKFACLTDVVGMFVNTLAIRNFPVGERTFVEFANEVQESFLLAFEHQDYPFEHLVELLDLQRDLSRNPVFDTMFVFQNNLHTVDWTNHVEALTVHSNVSKFDLMLFAEESENRLLFMFEYCTKLFKPETIRRMSLHFLELLREIILDSSRSIKDIQLVSTYEKSILDGFHGRNGTGVPKKTVIHQLEYFAEQNPDKVALVSGEEQLTFSELNQYSNQLARYLQKCGDFREQLIGIYMDRSPKMMISILAIWKLGAAYVPLDSNYPTERLRHIVDDSGISFILSDDLRNYPQHLSTFSEISWIEINKIACELDATDSSNIDVPVSMNMLAYIIYTSGSTGMPKGVMIEHLGMMNHIYAKLSDLQITELSIIAQTASHCFDISVWQFFSTIVSGGTCIIYQNALIHQFEHMLLQVQKDGVTVLEVVPSYLTALLEYIKTSGDVFDMVLSRLEFMLVTGEALSKPLVESWFVKYPNIPLVNAYGPTEASDDITHCIMDRSPDAHLISIGRPIQNMNVYVVDRYMNLCPVGVRGQICVSGIGVGRGYINQPDRTAKVFLKDPFDDTRDRLYLTGDLGRYLPDGTLEIFGRIDQQVKIRGYRIELEEIESIVLKIEGIKECVVMNKVDRKGQAYLCAFYVSNITYSADELRDYLSQTLPNYMIPSIFMSLVKLPLTANGKVHRQSLPEPDEEKRSLEHEQPVNELERKLVSMWEEILGVEDIGMGDHFFEMGGQSLKAMHFVTRLNKELGVELPLRNLFLYPTLRQIAAAIDEVKAANGNIFESIPLVPAALQDNYPVSSSQKRLYILNQINGTQTSYNMPVALMVDGLIVIEKLEKAFRKLIQRHESFRTSFQFVKGELVQVVDDRVDFDLRVEQSTDEQDTKRQIRHFIRPFSLSIAPLLRVKLIRMEPMKHLLLLDLHHIISDGVSLAIFQRELQLLYKGLELSEIPIQYKDYAVWQSKFVESARYKQQEEYWLSVFEGDVPVLDLPGDYPRPAVKSFEGASFSQPINLELSRALRRLASDTGTTVYMVLLGLLNVLLLKYSGQEDIVVGSPVAGRNHTDLEWVMGMFVNTLAIRNRPTGDKTFEAFLEEVKINAIHAFEHQDYPFEELVDKLNISRDMSRNPLFEVMLVYQNIVEPALQEGFGDEIRISAYDAELSGTAKFDLNVIVEDLGEGLLFQFEYCTRLFKRETVEQMAQHLMEIAWTVTADPHTQISAIPMLTQEERQLILYDFNDTDKAYSSEQTLHGLVEEQARRNPDAPALVLGNESMTYGELENKANRLARHLVEQGVAMGAHVGLMTQRGFAMVIGMLAILKAGAAYVPIDPAYPAERKRYIMDHAEIAALVTDRASEFEHDRTVRIDAELLAAYSAEPLDLPELARERAYVIYTSGSTGMPKGVMIGHRSVVNLIEWVNRRFLVNEADTLLFITSMCFDLSVYDIFGILAAGGRVVLAQTEEVQDPERLKGLMEEHRITFWDSVPTTMNYLIQHMERQDEKWQQSDLRLVFMSGDWIPVNLPSRIKNHFPGTEVLSLGGATEGTIWSNYYPIEEVLEEQSSIPYGKPIANSYFYILDKYLSPVPYGVPGELYIGGVGVAQGYLKDPEKTGTSFLKNPFLPEEGERMYKTGDVGLMLPDGNMQFIGRKDHQVKIRGYRVELGEVESALLRLEGVKEAIVMDREEREGGKYLCAYIVASEELKAKDLRSGLGRLIPDYMVPLAYVFLSQLPMTSNGKIDRKALPAPEGQERGETYTPPENEWEEKLASYWEELLDVRPIGVKSDFFELGGHSLKAAALIGKVYAEMQVELPLPYVFRYPTIRQLAERLREVTDWESEKPVLQFGDPSGEPIFAFPPAGGYGSVYKGLAEELEGFTVYGFDFIEDEARIVRYKQMIREIQPQGPYRLVGYSAGGNLAYEVAKAMEEDGEEIRELVMIDATRRTERINQTMEQMRAEVEKELPELEKMHAFMNVEPIRRKVIERSLLYNQYLNGIVNGGRIKANIHCIISEGRNRETGWRDVATSYREYSGFGQHLEMLDPSLVRRNTDILYDILVR